MFQWLLNLFSLSSASAESEFDEGRLYAKAVLEDTANKASAIRQLECEADTGAAFIGRNSPFDHGVLSVIREYQSSHRS